MIKSTQEAPSRFILRIDNPFGINFNIGEPSTFGLSAINYLNQKKRVEIGFELSVFQVTIKNTPKGFTITL